MIFTFLMIVLAVWVGWELLKLTIALTWGLIKAFSWIALILLPVAVVLLAASGLTVLLLPVIAVYGIGYLIGKHAAIGTKNP
ncbi:MAG: hypothetical protein ACOX8B_00090 [Lachnospiraceae bacterium]|jgi:hypothetical protein